MMVREAGVLTLYFLQVVAYIALQVVYGKFIATPSLNFDVLQYAFGALLINFRLSDEI